MELLAFEERGGAVIVRVATSEIELRNAPMMKEKISELLSSKPEHLILDLDQVSYVDSAGIGFMVDVKRGLEPQGAIYLVNVHEIIMKVLRVTALDRALNVHASVEAVLKLLP